MWDIIMATTLVLNPIKVLIIDTGVDNNKYYSPYLYKYEKATHYHGHAITGLILSGNLNDWVCKKVQVDVCDSSGTTMEPYNNCLRWALDNTYDFVNISLSGTNYSFEEEMLLSLIKDKSVVIVAAGNDNTNILGVYPAGYLYNNWNNFYVVTRPPGSASNFGFGTINVDGTNAKVLRLDGGIGTLSGTSASAALYTHSLLKQRCKDAVQSGR